MKKKRHGGKHLLAERQQKMKTGETFTQFFLLFDVLYCFQLAPLDNETSSWIQGEMVKVTWGYMPAMQLQATQKKMCYCWCTP